ncbi:N-acetylmuramoyl-L-alanine amidase [Stutzerimonas degradans]|nr:N-acetylmuramoyl-L-alanine amidase [Stutzerimonas degradans]
MRIISLVALFLLLAGCASGPQIDDRYRAVGQDSRVQVIVLHYTSSGLEHSLALLTEGEVSSHYLIGAAPATIYRLVDEDRRAWHAGQSEWNGRTWLNSSSIGIELVNRGYVEGEDGRRLWYPYTDEQIDALVLLLKDIMQRHGLKPGAIVGHSDIAAQRRSIPARCSPGSAWPMPAWCPGRMPRRWRRSVRRLPRRRRISPGSSWRWSCRATRCRATVSWMRRRATCSRPSR